MNGPLPIASVTCCIASVFASRSGMIAQYTCASAFGSSANGFFSRKRITLSDGAEISSVRAISSAAERIALGKALDRGDAVPRQHRRAVVELQAVAQRQFPQLAVALIDVPSTICGCTLKSAS